LWFGTLTGFGLFFSVWFVVLLYRGDVDAVG